MLRKFHRWVGLVLALPLALQALTGLVLLITPRLRAARPQMTPGARPVPADTQIAMAREAAPNGTVALDYAPPRWPGDSAAVGFGPPHTHHPAYTIAVDPNTGRVLRVTSNALFIAAHKLHTDLLLMPYGETATTIMGLLLTLMALTGLALWCPTRTLLASAKWTRAIIPTRQAGHYRFTRSLHQSAGFWTALLIGFMGASGAVMSLGHGHNAHDASSHHAMHDTIEDHAHSSHAPEADKKTDPTPVASILVRLKTIQPDAIVQDVSLTRDTPARLRVLLPNRSARTPILIDATTQDLAIPVAGNTSFRDTLRSDARLLHTADLPTPVWIASLWSTLIALAGLSLLSMSLTGVWMTVHRKRPQPSKRDETIPT